MDNRVEVEAVLQSFNNELTVLIDDAFQCKRIDIPDLQDRYKLLKDRLRASEKYGTVDGSNRDVTDSERKYLVPALRAALAHSLPQTNSNPKTWRNGLGEVQADIAIMLYKLKESK